MFDSCKTLKHGKMIAINIYMFYFCKTLLNCITIVINVSLFDFCKTLINDNKLTAVFGRRFTCLKVNKKE